MDFLLTFLEGVVAFVSPCMLPMLPLYLAYFAGEGAASPERERTLRTVASALGFVLGFSVVFVALGALAGAAGSFFVLHRRALEAACGVVVMLLGLNYLGIVHVDVLNRTFRARQGVVPSGFMGSVAFGVAFAVGWSPCVGTFLASALSLAATAGSAGRGIVLLACFSAGLGVPFVLSGVLVGQLQATLSWAKAHHGAIERASGVFLIAMGALMLTGTYGVWLRALAVL